jgi:hypothetical protein
MLSKLDIVYENVYVYEEPNSRNVDLPQNIRRFKRISANAYLGAKNKYIRFVMDTGF